MEKTKNNTPNRIYNYKLGYLRAIGIILVVLGHVGNGGVNILFDWFSPYSFHIPLLIFASGYFFDNASKVFTYIKKRFRRLVIPYYSWNLFYLVLFFALTSTGLLIWGYSINLDSFFVQPWLIGNQYAFNLAAWFVLSLFLIQVAYVLIRKALSKFKIKNEYYLFVFFLALGLLGTYLANLGYSTSVYLILGRTLFGLPFLHLGYLYKSKLEKFDKPSIGRIALLFTVQLGLILFYGNLNFWMYSMNFGGRIIQPFLSSLTGIYLCLQISAILAKNFSPNKLLRYIGDNSWTIMINHLLGFWLLNCVFFLFGANGFSEASFKSDVFYRYLINGYWQSWILYAVVGIFFSLALAYGVNKLSSKTKSFLLKFKIKKNLPP